MSIMSRDAYCDGASLPEHNFLLGFEPSSDVEDAPVVNVRRVLPARSLLSELIASNAEDRQHNELFVEYRDSMDTARTQNSEYSDEDSLESQITTGFQPNRSTQPIKIEKDDALMQKVQKECYRRMLVAYEAAEMQRALAYQAQMYKYHSHW